MFQFKKNSCKKTLKITKSKQQKKICKLIILFIIKAFKNWFSYFIVFICSNIYWFREFKLLRNTILQSAKYSNTIINMGLPNLMKLDVLILQFKGSSLGFLGILIAQVLLIYPRKFLLDNVYIFLLFLVTNIFSKIFSWSKKFHKLWHQF